MKSIRCDTTGILCPCKSLGTTGESTVLALGIFTFTFKRSTSTSKKTDMSTKRTRNELDKDVEIDHRQQRTVTTTTIPTTTATKLSASTSPPPLSKLARIIPTSPTLTNASQSQTEPESQARLLLCTLPPTCNPPHNKPTRLANTIALEAHYAKYHAHVCEERGCGAVFPEGRMLDLVRFAFFFSFCWC